MDAGPERRATDTVPRMTARSGRVARLIAATLPAAVAAAVALAGCGGSSSPPAIHAAPTPPAPSFNAANFPPAGGRSAAQLGAGLPVGGAVAPTQSIFHPGTNRFGFGLFDPGRKQITGAEVALYVGSATATNLRGPYPATEESLHVDPPFQSRTVARDPDAAKSVGVGQIPLGGARAQSVFVLARVGGRLEAFAPAAVPVTPAAAAGPPRVGQLAPLVHTPTAASVGGNVASIDTRQPPDDMHAVDFASVRARMPVLLLFATPQLCQSRVCGPVVDIAEELKSRLGGQAEFIHMEIYNDNQVANGFRPPVRAFRLPTEPWAFAIDRHGRIAARIEGAFSLAELTSAMQRAISA